MKKYKYATVFLVSTLLVGGLMLLSIIVSIPKSPISISADSGQAIRQIIPQGWGFFSRDPRAPLLDAINIESGNKLQWPNSSVENYFGFSRFGRAQGIELGSISSHVSISDYKKCEGSIEECYKNITEFIQVENKHKNPSICGKWLIINSDPIPWAWSSKYKEITMNSEIVGVEVTCSEI